MVSVPRLTENRVNVAPQARSFQNIEAPSAAFGSLQAEATQQGANELAKAAQRTEQIAVELQRREDETRLLEYETKLENYETETLYTNENAVLNTKGNQAFGSTKTSLDDFDTFTESIDKELTSERQRLAAQRIKARSRTALARTVSRHESAQRRVWESSVRQAAMESARDKAVLNYTDDVTRNAAIARLKQAVRLDSAGLPKEAIDQRIEQEVTGIHASVIERYAMDDLASAKDYYKEHKDEIDPDAHIRIEKSFKVMEKQAQAEARHEVNQQIGVIEDTLKLGLDVPESQINAVKQAANANGLTKQADSLDQMMRVYDSNKEFLNVPLAEQPQVLEELRQSIQQNGATTEKLAKYQLMQSSFNTKLKTLRDDPVSYYEQRKEIRPFKPVDIGNADAFRYEVDQRRVAVAEVQQKEGIRLPLLRKAEIEQLRTAYQGSNVEGRTALINNIQSVFNGPEARAVAKKIAPNEKNLATVMSIVHEAPDVAAKVASGATRDKFVSRNAIAAELQTHLEGAVQDGVALETITESVHDLYTELAFEGKDTTNVLDPDRLKEAADAIIGPKMKVKTGFFDSTPSHLIPFRMQSGQFISEGQFEAALKTIDLKTMLETHGDTFKTPEGINLDVQETIGRTRLVTVGDGKYELHTRTGQQVIGSDPSKPFVLDMKKIVNDENIQGFFERVTSGFSQTELDDYVEASQRLSTLIESNADQAEIDEAEKTLENMRIRSERKAFERNLSSIREGF